MSNVFARIGADWEDFRVEMGELVGSEDTVVAIGSYAGTYRATSKPMTVRSCTRGACGTERS